MVCSAGVCVVFNCICDASTQCLVLIARLHLFSLEFCNEIREFDSLTGCMESCTGPFVQLLNFILTPYWQWYY